MTAGIYNSPNNVINASCINIRKYFYFFLFKYYIIKIVK